MSAIFTTTELWFILAAAWVAVIGYGIYEWYASRRVAQIAEEPDELDAWLAMSPTPTHDRLCVEFFDAALGNKDGVA